MGGSHNPPADAQHIAALCEQASAGDHDALECLLLQHHDRLFDYVRRKIGVDWRERIDAEDLLQETYVAIFQSIGDFRCQDAQSFYHWSARIVDHRFIDRVRRLRRLKRNVQREVSGEQRRDSAHAALLDRCAASGARPSTVARRQEAIAALMGCVARLPDHYQTVVRRVYLNDEPVQAVAADLGRSDDAVRRLGGRALKQLSLCMGRATHYLSGHD